MYFLYQSKALGEILNLSMVSRPVRKKNKRIKLDFRASLSGYTKACGVGNLTTSSRKTKKIGRTRDKNRKIEKSKIPEMSRNKH